MPNVTEPSLSCRVGSQRKFKSPLKMGMAEGKTHNPCSRDDENQPIQGLPTFGYANPGRVCVGQVMDHEARGA
jgi:hypothetical protein